MTPANMSPLLPTHCHHPFLIYIPTPLPSLFLTFLSSFHFLSNHPKLVRVHSPAKSTEYTIIKDMGICTSCESTAVATAKVVLQDGRLQEYSYPVRVSYVLAKDPSSFLCNSDEMEFDDVVRAVREDAELEPGQLYFALPLSKLRRPLQAEEMAALAVKANAALLKSGGGEKCGCRKKGGKGFFGAERSGKVADGGAALVEAARWNGNGNNNGSRNGNGGRKMFAANLSVIAE